MRLSAPWVQIPPSPPFLSARTFWAAVEPHLPRGKTGKPRVDDRRVISGILHVLKTGCRRDCPAKYGPHTTIYNRYNRWSKRRIWSSTQRFARAYTGLALTYGYEIWLSYTKIQEPILA